MGSTCKECEESLFKSEMGNMRHILVIDDEPAICGMLTEYFQRHTFDITTTLLAAEGMQVLTETRIDLVILDIALEDADGLELLEVIKHHHPTLPVVMLTGIGYDEELVAEARLKKASAYVSKQLPLEQLLMEVQHALKTPSKELTV